MDFYTKTVLSVIAAALCVLAAENGIHKAWAAGDPVKVMVCADEWNCAKIDYSGALKVVTK